MAVAFRFASSGDLNQRAHEKSQINERSIYDNKPVECD